MGQGRSLPQGQGCFEFLERGETDGRKVCNLSASKPFEHDIQSNPKKKRGTYCCACCGGSWTGAVQPHTTADSRQVPQALVFPWRCQLVLFCKKLFNFRMLNALVLGLIHLDLAQLSRDLTTEYFCVLRILCPRRPHSNPK